MKQIYSITLTGLLFITGGVTCMGQLRVDSIGHVGFGKDSVVFYNRSAGSQDENFYQAYLYNNKYGLYSECFNSTRQSGWGYALEGFADVDSYNFTVGVKASALSKSNTCNGSRAFGLFARAGWATPGYNYAVFGNLMNNSNGAAIYGSVVHGNVGLDTNGRYSAYLVGDVKVTGDITVVDGTVTFPTSSSGNATTSQLSASGGSTLSKIAGLVPISYHIDPEESAANMESAVSDTLSSSAAVEELDFIDYDKLHYGLSVEELEQIFPELVYEKNGGEKSVNYIEMVPLLIQAVKELTAKVAALEEKSSVK